MRRVVVLAILALMVVPTVAWADIIIVNKGGTISVTQAGVVSKGSRLHQYNDIVAAPGHSLGSVEYATGGLVSGSIEAGGVFSSAGSSFIVTGKNNQVPHGVIFSGTFTGDITWTLVSQQGTKSFYQLTGNLTGQLFDGRTVTGTTTQNFYTYQNQLKQGVGHITIGNTNLNAPEPGSLSLLGTGLAGIAGLVRRRLRS
jgi:hypothetical protein